MGIFSRSYYKEGPGVDPNEPQKRAFFRFFAIFKRKLGHFTRVNLIYSALCIPTFVIVFLLMLYITGNMFGAIYADMEGIATVNMVIACMLSAFYIAVMGVGPVTAGITYVMRNFAREEHAWVWDDFKDALKSNFKQAIIVFVIDIVITLFLFIAIYLYIGIGGKVGMLRYGLYVFGLIYMLMHFYIYQIMVTFELSLKDIFKNSLLLTLGKLPLNLFLLIMLAVIHVVIPVALILAFGVNVQYTLIALVVLTVLELVVTQAFSAFLVNFGVQGTIKKYMIDVQNEDK